MDACIKKKIDSYRTSGDKRPLIVDFSSLEEVVKNYESKNFSCTFNK